MTPTNGVTSVADYFRRAEMSGRWRLGGIASGGFGYAGTAGGGVFRSVRSTAAVRVIPRPRPRPTPAPRPREFADHRGRNTCGSLAHPRPVFSLLLAIPSKVVRVTGTRES